MRGTCTCRAYDKCRSCKHIGACLYHYYYNMFKTGYYSDITSFSKDILNKYDFGQESKIKKEVLVDLIIEHKSEYNYYYD